MPRRPASYSEAKDDRKPTSTGFGQKMRPLDFLSSPFHHAAYLFFIVNLSGGFLLSYQGGIDCQRQIIPVNENFHSNAELVIPGVNKVCW